MGGCTLLLRGSQWVVKASLLPVLWAQIFPRELMGSDRKSEAELDYLLVLGIHIVYVSWMNEAQVGETTCWNMREAR